MNPLLIIGVIVVLVGLLVYRRRRAGGPSDAAAIPAPATPVMHPPSAPTPLARPVGVAGDMPSAPAPGSPPPPSSWIPEETIVEPGWPLPGEISGAWSPVTSDTGAAAAVRDAPVAEIAPIEAPVALTEPPVAEPNVEESVDEWLMPESAPVEWSPGAEDIAPMHVPEPAHAGPAFAADEAAVTVWGPVAPPPETEIEAPPECEEAPPEPEPEAELPLWTPVAASEPDPVQWTFDAHPEEPAPDPEPVVATEIPAPIAAWPDPLPEPLRAPEPEPEVAAFLSAEPPRAPAIVEEAHDQWLAVADLAPILEGLLPLTRISDRAGVTPRMLVLMRTLANGALSVSEQARLLDVSRPVVADLSARLESLGLAQRERDESDRRRVRIALTERGRRVCDEAPGTPEPSAIAARLALMDPGARDELIRGVRALERVAAAR